MDEMELVTLAEAGRRAGLSAARMYQLAKRPGFPEMRRVGAYRLVDAAEVARWLQERTLGKAGRPPKQRPG
jgi:predicted DNA-binding transcriptional regulator AlpA